MVFHAANDEYLPASPRVPDENGLYLSRNCRLSHTRLSILNCSRAGKQPMARQLGNQRAVITYNGEIYNMPALRRELEQEALSLKQPAIQK